MNIAILGRETNLARAELESIATELTHLDRAVSLFSPTSHDFTIDQLGGMIKYGPLVAEIDFTSDTIVDQLKRILLDQMPAQGKKITFGLSIYGKTKVLSPYQIHRLAKDLKQTLRQTGTPVRFVSAKQADRLSAAEIIYNGLTRAHGYEFILYFNQNKLYLGRSQAVQDINSYSLRDHSRPCRNAKVGMLPPKLAQIMINLAMPDHKAVIVDPFCGSGTVCAEALLAGHDAVGSDISGEMIECTAKNLNWLKDRYGLSTSYELLKADATQTHPLPVGSVVVTETYLGPPQVKFPTKTALAALQKETGSIILAFLRQLASRVSLRSTTVICLPFWYDGRYNHTLEIIDQIRDLGYTTSQFTYSTAEELLYRRPDQIVGRQILVLKRI